jgi:hypothetical protein
MYHKASLRKLPPKKGIDDKRDSILRNDFFRNLEETFYKDEIDITKETGRVRGQAFF